MDLSKVLFCLILLLAFSEGVLSQGADKQTKVHLKDGSILIGEIVEDTDYYIKLATTSFDTIEIGYKFILGFDDDIKYQKIRNVKTPIVIKEDGLFLTASLGLIEQRGGDFDGVRASVTAGKRMTKRLNLGLEIGRQNHVFISNVAYGESSFFTVGLYGKYFLSTKPNRWFIDASVGYGLPLTEDDFFEFSHSYNGGTNAQFNAGRQWSLNNKFSLFFSGGLGYQHVTGDIFTNWNGPVSTSYRKEFLYPTFSIGVEF